jgi:nitrite reductase/ring-hydroxylating ferredoxin subunit
MISIGKLDELNAHSRYIVSLRSISLESKYHSIVIYAVEKEHSRPTGPELDVEKDLARRLDSVALGSDAREWHAMEEECPHLGASMAEAEIEIEDDGAIAICPWHKLGLLS